MKRKLLAGIISLVVLILMGCDTGTSGGSGSGPVPVPGDGDGDESVVIKSIGSGARVYVLTIGENYELKIIKPINSGGNIACDTETTNGTVQSKAENKITLKPTSGNAFTITLDSQGNMIELEDKSAEEDGFLFPVGQNTVNIDGVWGLIDKSGNVETMTFTKKDTNTYSFFNLGVGTSSQMPGKNDIEKGELEFINATDFMFTKYGKIDYSVSPPSMNWAPPGVLDDILSVLIQDSNTMLLCDISDAPFDEEDAQEFTRIITE